MSQPARTPEDLGTRMNAHLAPVSTRTLGDAMAQGRIQGDAGRDFFLSEEQLARRDDINRYLDARPGSSQEQSTPLTGRDAHRQHIGEIRNFFAGRPSERDAVGRFISSDVRLRQLENLGGRLGGLRRFNEGGSPARSAAQQAQLERDIANLTTRFNERLSSLDSIFEAQLRTNQQLQDKLQADLDAATSDSERGAIQDRLNQARADRRYIEGQQPDVATRLRMRSGDLINLEAQAEPTERYVDDGNGNQVERYVARNGMFVGDSITYTDPDGNTRTVDVIDFPEITDQDQYPPVTIRVSRTRMSPEGNVVQLPAQEYTISGNGVGRLLQELREYNRDSNGLPLEEGGFINVTRDYEEDDFEDRDDQAGTDDNEGGTTAQLRPERRNLSRSRRALLIGAAAVATVTGVFIGAYAAIKGGIPDAVTNALGGLLGRPASAEGARTAGEVAGQAVQFSQEALHIRLGEGPYEVIQAVAGNDVQLTDAQKYQVMQAVSDHMVESGAWYERGDSFGTNLDYHKGIYKTEDLQLIKDAIAKLGLK